MAAIVLAIGAILVSVLADLRTRRAIRALSREMVQGLLLNVNASALLTDTQTCDHCYVRNGEKSFEGKKKFVGLRFAWTSPVMLRCAPLCSAVLRCPVTAAPLSLSLSLGHRTRNERKSSRAQ